MNDVSDLGAPAPKIQREQVDSICMTCEFGVVMEEGTMEKRIRRIHCRLINALTWSEMKKAHLRTCTHHQLREQSALPDE